jgi:hypothetical protein
VSRCVCVCARARVRLCVVIRERERQREREKRGCVCRCMCADGGQRIHTQESRGHILSVLRSVLELYRITI